MNKVVLLGRITKDPEAAYTNTGKIYIRMNVAVDRPYANADGTRETDFIPVVAWGKMAETIAKHFSKGHRILAMGRIKVGSYEKEGEKRYSFEVVMDDFKFIETKKSLLSDGYVNSSTRISADTGRYEDIPF